MKNKLICTLLACITLLGLLVPVYANEATATTSSSAAATVDRLDHTVYLTSDEVMELIETRTRLYLDSDSATKGTTFTAEFIPLNDTDGNLFAYMVPMVQNGVEVGYVTASARRDAHTVYQISYNDEQPYTELDIARNTVQRADSMTDSLTDTELIFFPPMYYYVREITPATEDIYSVDMIEDGQPEDVSDWFEDNAAEITAFYASLTNDDPAELDVLLGTVESAAPTLMAPVLDYRLQREWNENLAMSQRFVPIYYNNQYNYGGDQGWYTGSMRDNGCGPVAMANTFAYMKLYHKWSNFYAPLFPYTLTHSNFVTFMNTCYRAINPSAIGPWNFNDTMNKIQKWAANEGVQMGIFSISSSITSSKEKYEDLVINGLYNDYPIITCNLHPPKMGYDYAWHYMTITKYFRAVGGEKWIAVSTWGRRDSIDWDTYIGHVQWFGGGVGHFM